MNLIIYYCALIIGLSVLTLFVKYAVYPILNFLWNL